MTTLHRLLIAVLVAAAVSSCSIWPKITGKERRSEERARQVEAVQQTCQRFADGYAGQILEVTVPIKKKARDPQVINELSAWQITQLNSAYTIATGPSPVVCLLDFVVLATLSRMVAEDALVRFDGDLLSPLPRIHRDLEREAWTNVAAVLTPAQVDELQGLIAAWRAKNPSVMLVGFVHFSEFAQAAGSSSAARGAPGGLFGLIGLDPLAGLDPAVKQIEQTRLLAERVIFYMQRVPYLMDVQAERVVAQATLAPEVARANASLERASLAMSDYARIAADLPDALARERDALIRQLSGEMLRQQDELRGLLVDLQTTLAAGSQTAAAVDSAVKSLDRLAARFPPREPGTESAADRPFDINEYTAAAAAFTGTARQLTELLDTLGREGQPAVAAVAGGVESARGVVDYLFWRALLLGLLLIAAGLAAVLAYRVLAPRLGRPRLDS